MCDVVLWKFRQRWVTDVAHKPKYRRIPTRSTYSMLTAPACLCFDVGLKKIVCRCHKHPVAEQTLPVRLFLCQLNRYAETMKTAFPFLS